MPYPIFSGNTFVYLYGDPALTFLDSSDGVSNFKVHGFQDPEIFIEDHRHGTRSAVDAYFLSHMPITFYPVFNGPAQVDLYESEYGTIKVVLHEAENNRTITEYLWIAIGIGNEIPVYDYRIWRITPLEKDKYAIFSIFTIDSSPVDNLLVECTVEDSRVNI